MSLYIIRHANALDAEEDTQRPLSRKGRQQVHALAAFLKDRDVLVAAEVWHSPLARSRETAEALVKGLGLKARLVEVAGLEGDADPATIAKRLRDRREPLALVGHEPHLSALLSLLVAGATRPPRFVLKKCAAVALEKLEGQWAVRWQISPEIVGHGG